jgi:hypothetical protein
MFAVPQQGESTKKSEDVETRLRLNFKIRQFMR